MFRVDSIKRAARKEAWYSDSYNPFRKTTKSNTWGPSRQGDIESGGDGIQSLEPVRPYQTSPESPNGLGAINDDGIQTIKAEENHMTKANGAGESRSSEPDSGSTVVDRRSSRGSRPMSQEQKARHRFLSKFKGGNKGADDNEREEKKEKNKLNHKPFTLRNQLQATIFNSWINILIIAAPVGIGLNYAGVNKIVVFVVNFIAIIPLAAMLSFATEEISLHVGETLGGLLNASFGNAVELIVAIIALAKKEVLIVQTSLIGSILSNLLLVMGMCFFFGGLRRSEQFFNQTVAQTAASLLALAVASVIIPTAFDLWSTTTVAVVAAISRGTAIILLVVYCGYLYFQLKTHNAMFQAESQKVAMRPRKHAMPEGGIAKGIARAGGLVAAQGRAQLSDRPPNDELLNSNAYEENREEEEAEEPQLHILVAWATLAGATAIIGLCAEFMVDSISAVTAGGAISEEFVGLILLPIVGNAAEHATAVTVACKDKMDLAIGVAVGSSMQVALLLLPLMVVIGWIMGQDDMTLSFDGFQVAVLFMAVLLVNYLIGDGKSHWLEGMLLQCLYVIIAVCAWYYPANGVAG
ncbi:putative Ca2+-transport (H+ exchange) protein [Coleophoma cylindrospora]|uniref:Putative Ca2+-transport (H+ exchange) protein n=1 Tax=Coleophoma cylindrospora TaxID=1849047 RepID=A0A3D8R5J1_9HELO|nr:putative Ca2+-transport (H+ exchange) protein [Coleophoma cylindrospora]